MKIEERIIPEFYLSALINGDSTNLSDQDEKALDEFIESELKDFPYFNALSNTENLGFLKYHDLQPFGVLACECVKLSFAVS